MLIVGVMSMQLNALVAASNVPAVGVLRRKHDQPSRSDRGALKLVIGADRRADIDAAERACRRVKHTDAVGVGWRKHHQAIQGDRRRA